MGRKLWMSRETVKPLPYPAKLLDTPLPDSTIEVAAKKVRLPC